MSNIKQTIDDNIYQNGQQKIRGDILNNVLNAMVDDSDEKLTQLALEMDDKAGREIVQGIADASNGNCDLLEAKVNALIGAFGTLVKSVVFHTNGYNITTELQSLMTLQRIAPYVNTSAVSGNATSGVAICGTK